MYVRLKILRKNNKLTQKFIAEKLNISTSLYSNYENGKSTIPVHLLSILAKFYGTSIDYIIEDTDEIKRN